MSSIRSSEEERVSGNQKMEFVFYYSGQSLDDDKGRFNLSYKFKNCRFFFNFFNVSIGDLLYK